MQKVKLYQKIEISVFVILVVCAILTKVAVVNAEEAAPTVTQGGIIYTIDTENQTATVSQYVNREISEQKEVTVLSRISYGGKAYTVTEIASGAFSSSAHVEKIEIPITVKKIGVAAFYQCSALKEIKLPEGMQAIEASTFVECLSLVSVVIPDTVTSIGDAAFCNCPKLVKITIPSGVSYIGNDAFFLCESLEEIALPEKLSETGAYVFGMCSNLKKVVIPEGVKKLGPNYFIECTALEQIVIPESVSDIAGTCFEGCTSLKSIYYPRDLSWPGLAFFPENTARVNYVTNPDGTVSLSVDYLPEGMSEIELPADIGGRKIVSVTGGQGENIPVSCTNHYTKTYAKSADSHQYTCVVCRKPVKEVHDYEKGLQPCVCGYVPFAISEQPRSLSLAYGTGGKLSAMAKVTFGTEKVTCQWFEDGKMISGATAAAYAIPQGKAVGTYTYTCKLVCSGYSQVTKAAIVTVKPPVKGKKYKDDTNMATYKVTKVRMGGKGTVEYVKAVNKKRSTVIITSTVKIGGVA
nr:leucine-rich repeat domain-containing protein [Lachnospiraceae bacterium]